MKVLIVRSDSVAWDGLHDAICRERRGKFEVVGDVSTANAALEAARVNQPEVVLTTVPVSCMATISFLRELRSACPNARLAIVIDGPSALNNEEYAGLADIPLQGAFLWREISQSTADHWMVAIARGMLIYSPELLDEILGTHRECGTSDADQHRLKVLLADANALTRAGLRTLLDLDNRFDVVGETSGNVVNVASKLNPDLIVLESMFRGEYDAGLIAELREKLAATRICIYTNSADLQLYLDSLKEGVSGYVVKSSDHPHCVLDAIALAGHRAFAVADRTVTSKFNSTEAIGSVLVPGEFIEAQLTSRERQVVSLLIDGQSPKDITDDLVISERTVESHRRKAAAKLRAGTREQLAAKAIRSGLVPFCPSQGA